MGRGIKALVAICALVAFLAVLQSYLRPKVVPFDGALETEEIRGALIEIVPVSKSPELRRATVSLKDGTKIEAPVIPGCKVQVGDTVRVLVTRTKEATGYLVLGAL